ncbi:MAG: DUF1016 family protein [Planctomycetes bacterium]|nr:DUF1016 family protein [Planctomycetota bacterium]
MNYSVLINTIAKVHQQAQAGAASAVNRHLVLRNWLIGFYLIEFEQNGKDRAEYGAGLLDNLSHDLRIRGINGLGVSMLKNCRQFYKIYPQFRQLVIGEFRMLGSNSAIRQSAIGESDIPMKNHSAKEEKVPKPLSVETLFNFSWTHFIEFIRLEEPWKKAFYENECLRGNWSVRQLQRQIGSLLYERTGLSSNKKAVIEAGRKQASEAPQTIADIIRDPYVLEFTGLPENPLYHESTLETALLNHLQAFLLELGNGFCFEARQKRITVGKEHDYIDLVFYHRVLRCHLLIDLKIRAFQHGDAGQMNFYLNYWKDRIMAKEDSSPVGLILCTDKNQTKVEYAVGGMNRRLFVSRYMIALPKPEEIQHLIENDRAHWEQQQFGSKKK